MSATRVLLGAFAEARRGLSRRRRRSSLTALGIALAAAMLSAALVVGDGLGNGFDRAAKAAGLPDMIVRFDPQSARRVSERIAALPDIAGYSLRFEVTNASIAATGHRRGDAVAEVVGTGHRRGYAVVAGRDLGARRPEALLERALAQAWGVRLGAALSVGDLGPQKVVGFVEAPDDVGFPLAKPRFYVARSAIEARFGAPADPNTNFAEIWLRDPRYLNEVLVQARATSFGLRNIRFATRTGVRVLHDQAAGIVIDLLVALSVIALITAGVMLAASARAEVQRRLGAIGVRRALGATREHVALSYGLEALLVAAPAASVGVAAGVLATYGPATRLLTLLNEPAPGRALALPLIGGWMISVAIPVAAAAWPSFRAASGSVVGLLRAADVSAPGGGSRTRARERAHSGGLAVLGVRLVAARRVRLLATVVTLGLSAAFVLLLLSLATALNALETDPGALGRRYQLTAAGPPSLVPRVRHLRDVQAAASRYELQAADSFSLGETIDVIAYAGDHTAFEAPPLQSGRRLAGTDQAEVGAGLANALGLTQGSTLALALPSGKELRLRVAGIVSSLDHDGRVAYIPAAALLAADPSAPARIAIRLVPLADQASVTAALSALGAQVAAASGAVSRGKPLVDVLRTILRGIAIVDGLVCLYALMQACGLVVQERRRTVAVLRACGAGPRAVRQLLLGAALALVVPAALLGLLLERLVFGPGLSRLAASYATLALAPTLGEVLAVLAGLALASGAAVLWVARQASRESVISGLAS
ncbi:MAG: FtsX-like permease family protein [Solirubrobacteraceae bacterium]